MVCIENHIGKINLSEKYLTELVKKTVSDCFGVAGVCEASSLRCAVSALSKGKLCGQHKGIQLRYDKERGLIINLHIKVTYGVNLSAVVKSITHKVSFSVEEATGISVSQVIVCIDGINY